MGVIKRADDQWAARLYRRGKGGYDWLGTWATREEAQKKFEEAREAQIFHRETIKHFAERWLREYNHATKGGEPRWSRATLDGYRGALKPLIARFGNLWLTKLTIAEVRPWALTQSEAYVRAAAAMFADARRDGLIESNPFEKLRLPKSPGRKNIVAITAAELAQLCTIARLTWGPTFEAMVAVGGYCCLRPGEIFALRPESIDYEHSEIHVTQAFSKTGELGLPKSRKPRRVYMPPECARRIQAAPRDIYCEYLFAIPRSRRFTTGTLNYRWTKVVTAFEASLPSERRRELQEARGGKSMDFYELRHYGATERLRRGASPIDVAEEMGHSDEKLVLRLYGHPEDDHRIARIKAAYGQNVADLRPADAESDAAEA